MEKIKNDITINRPLFESEDFNGITKKESKLRFKLPKCPEKDKRLEIFLSHIKVLIPPTDWLLNYDCKQYILNDVIAGVTQFILHVPQGLAYGIMAGYEAINGIYTSFFPVLVYVFLGSSRHNSIGTFAIVALLTTSAIHSIDILCEDDDECGDGKYTAIEIGTALTFYIGIIQLLMWALRLGILSTILSSAFISAFTTAAAWHTITANFCELFGIKNERTGGLFKLLLVYYDLFQKIPTTNLPTFVVSVICLSILIFNNEYLQPWWNKKTKLPLPVELILLLAGDLISYLTDLGPTYKIKVVGFIPTGLPTVIPPNFFLFPVVLPHTISIVIVSYAITVSLAITFSKKCNTFVDTNQELLAMGFSNVVGSFFGCFPICGSLARGVLTVKLGGMTQLASLLSCVLLLLLILWIGPLFEYLPRAILATVIIASLRNVLFQIKDVPRYWRLSKTDFSVWIVTFLSSVILQIDLGLYIGIGFSILIIMVTTFSPRVVLLGSLPETEFYLEQKEYNVDTIDNVRILCYKGELMFSMKQLLLNRLKTELKFDVRDHLIQSRKKQTDHDRLGFNVLILDLSGTTHLDPTGCECLTELYSDYKQVGVEVIIAGITGENYGMLKRYRNVLKIKNFPLLFPSTHDAVVYAKDNIGK